MSSENAILIVLTTPTEIQGSGTKWVLQPGTMIVGRHPSCNIMLPDRQISREHARITHTRDGFYIEDLGSKNGTFVNGEAVLAPRLLHESDVIQIGLAYKLSFIEAEGTVPLTEDAERAFTLRLDTEKKQVWVSGKLLDPPLSPQQFDLLHMLQHADGGIVDRDAIAEIVWGSSDGVTEQAIDALMRRLRRRLAELNPTKEFIVTVRGYGFRLEL